MKELSSRTPVPRSQHALLYVEDEDPNWEVVQARLGDKFTLHRARTAQDACELLRTAKTAFAGILMDIQLMGSAMDGVQLAQAIRNKIPQEDLPPFARGIHFPDLPIIFVTAFGSKYSEATLRAAGGNKVIHKPIDFAELSLALAGANLDLVLGKKVRSI